MRSVGFLPAAALALACLPLLSAGAAAAPSLAPPALPDGAAAILSRAGYRKPAVLAIAAGVAVVEAQKGSRRHVVAVVCRESGGCARQVVPLGTFDRRAALTAEAAPFAAAPDLVEARVTATTVDRDGSSASKTIHYLVRTGAPPALTCEFAGSHSRDPGPKCGSGVSETVTVSPALGTGDFEVVSEGTGYYSVLHSSGGGCLQRSPVRGAAHRWRYTIPPRGKCTRRRVAPAGD